MRFLAPGRIRQLWYMPVLALAMGLMMLRSLVLARLFSLDSFAEYSAGLLVSSTFCMLACLGLQPMLQRDMPMLLVRRQERAGAVLLGQCVLVACACVIICAVVVAAGVSISIASKNVLIIGLLHGLSQQLFLLATIESRSRMQTTRFARQNLMRGLGVFFLGFFVAFYTRSAQITLLTEAAVTFALALAILLKIFDRASIRYSAAFLIGLHRIQKLPWRSAITLFFVSAVGFIVYSIDRWVAAQSLNKAQFALYAFAGLVLTTSGAVQVLINASVFPLLARRYAQLGKKQTYSLCKHVSVILLIICIVSGVGAYFLINAGIAHWLPQYEGVRVLLPLFIFVGCLRISNFWPSFLIVCGYEARLLVLDLSAGLCAIFFWLAWTQPWRESALGIKDIATLAVLMSICSYILSAGAAKHIDRVSK